MEGLHFAALYKEILSLWKAFTSLQETLDYVYKEILSLWKAFTQQPFMGLDCSALAQASSDSLAARKILAQ